MSRNIWIMKKEVVESWDPHNPAWFIGDSRVYRRNDTWAIFCDTDMHKVFPSLKTRNRVKVKITKRARPHTFKLILTRGCGALVCKVQADGFMYSFRPLATASRWLNNMAGLTYEGQHKSIWVSFETIKE